MPRQQAAARSNEREQGAWVWRWLAGHEHPGRPAMLLSALTRYCGRQSSHPLTLGWRTEADRRFQMACPRLQPGIGLDGHERTAGPENPSCAYNYCPGSPPNFALPPPAFAGQPT